MINHNLIQFNCQFSLTEEQLNQFLHIVKPQNFKGTINNQPSNDAIFELSNSQHDQNHYTAKELATKLGLNCSNDVEYLAKKLVLKTAKYGKWFTNSHSSNSINQFYYNNIALERLRAYLKFTGVKVA